MSGAGARAARKQSARAEPRIPDFETDINTLIDYFYLEVQAGKPCNLSTFKAVWSSLHFSFIHQAGPSVLNATDHLQLLFSAALNRLDTGVPILAGAVAEAWRRSQAQAQAQAATQAGGGGAPEPGAAAPRQADPERSGDEQGQGGRDQEHQQEVQQQQQQQQQRQQQQQHDELTPDVEAAAHMDQLQELDDLFSFLDHEGSVPHPSQGSGATAQPPSVPRGPRADFQALAPAPPNLGASPSTCPPRPSGQPPPSAAAAARMDQHQCEPTPHAHQPADHGEEGPPDPGAQGPAAARSHLPPLAVRIGAIYTLYCLYQTQVLRPRCNIYLPLLLLELLVSMVPELEAHRAVEALKMLKVLWQGDAFLVGESRRPASFLTRSPHYRHLTPNLSISERLMDNRAVRDALFHLRSDLKSLTDFNHLRQVTQDYVRSRERTFQPHPGFELQREHAHACPSSPEEGLPSTSGRLPPMLFPAGFASELQQGVEEASRHVQLSLLPRRRVKRKREGGAAAGEAGGAGADAGAAEGAAAGAAADEAYVAGNFGDLLRRAKAKAPKRTTRPDPSQLIDLSADLDDGSEDAALMQGADDVDVEGAFAGLSGRAAAVVRLQAERQRLCSQVQQQWLHTHRRLMQAEEAQAQAQAPAGDRGAVGSDDASAGHPHHEQQRGTEGGADNAGSPGGREAAEVGGEAAAAVAAAADPGRPSTSGAATGADGGAEAERGVPSTSGAAYTWAQLQAAGQGRELRGSQGSVQSAGEAGAGSDAVNEEVQASFGEEGGSREVWEPEHTADDAMEGRGLAADEAMTEVVLEAEEAMADADLAADEGIADADVAADDGTADADLAADDGTADADLAAELDVEFGDGSDHEDGAEWGADVGDGLDDGSGRHNGTSSPHAQAHVQPVRTLVWCNGKPGVFVVGVDGYSVRCFCPECREGEEQTSLQPLGFVQHCGLKAPRWRQSISVDAELEGEVAARGGDAVYVAGLLEGRAAVKRGGKKLGDWLQEAEQRGLGVRAKKRVRQPKGAGPPAVSDLALCAGGLGAAAAAAAAAALDPTPAPAPAPVVGPPQLDDEYADVLAQFESFNKVMASVQQITGAGASDTP